MKKEIKKFEGIGAALVTPFNTDFSLDYKALAKLLDHTAPHLNYWVVNGTTSESPTLTEDEKKHILDFIFTRNSKNIPIVLGLGGYNTQQIISSLKKIDPTKISAILSVSPPYNRPTQKGLVAHYTALANNSPVPIILYNVPSRTGNNIEWRTTLQLAEHPNIIGIKEASGNLIQSMAIARKKTKDFLLISGDDLLTIPLMAIGAEGVISVFANAFPKSFSQVIQEINKNNYTQAQKIMYSFFEINQYIFSEGNPSGIKAVLEMLGIVQNVLRLPLDRISEVLYKKIKQQLLKFSSSIYNTDDIYS